MERQRERVGAGSAMHVGISNHKNEHNGTNMGGKTSDVYVKKMAMDHNKNRPVICI